MERGSAEAKPTVARAVLRERRVQFGCFCPPLDPAFLDPRVHRGARAIEQGPHDAIARHRPDAGEPRDAAAAQDTVEHSFGLVRPCMAGGDAVHSPRLHQLAIELLADAPRSLFYVVV